ncbi:MAG: carboxymuconolactone decarboxylase family protein [Candidatus Rokubacteria bacterium]|nr:carboxymuconolactone decarboxylase family protein [Candidatus Rokubacteria bacterium]
MSTSWVPGRDQGITEEVVAALADYERGPFTEREKAALRYADQMYFDHHKIDDGLFSQLRERFNDDEVLELSWVIGEFISVGKIVHVLGVPYGDQREP